MMYAALNGKLDLFTFLFPLSSVKSRDRTGRSIIHYLAQSKVLYFVFGRCSCNLFFCQVNGSPYEENLLKEAKALVSRDHVPPHDRDFKGNFPAHYAAGSGHILLLEYLVDTMKFDVNMRNLLGQVLLKDWNVRKNCGREEKNESREREWVTNQALTLSFGFFFSDSVAFCCRI
jgi:hypothetical protein